MIKKSAEKKDAKNQPDHFKNQLKNLSKTDFDGHTEFRNLSYKDRLLWLSRAVRFSKKYSKTVKR